MPARLGRRLLHLDAFPVGMQVIDAKGLLRYANAACETLQGFRRAETCGKKHVWDLLADDGDRRALRTYVRFVVREQPRPTPYVIASQSDDGNAADVRMTWSYIRDAKGKVLGLFSVLCPDTMGRGR